MECILTNNEPKCIRPHVRLLRPPLSLTSLSAQDPTRTRISLSRRLRALPDVRSQPPLLLGHGQSEERHQVFCRMSLTWALSDVFLLVKTGIGLLKYLLLHS